MNQMIYEKEVFEREKIATETTASLNALLIYAKFKSMPSFFFSFFSL